MHIPAMQSSHRGAPWTGRVLPTTGAVPARPSYSVTLVTWSQITQFCSLVCMCAWGGIMDSLFNLSNTAVICFICCASS
jgi:hypothetical protein